MPTLSGVLYYFSFVVDDLIDVARRAGGIHRCRGSQSAFVVKARVLGSEACRVVLFY